MTEIKLRTDCLVALRKHMADDTDVVEAAKVSTSDEFDPDSLDFEDKRGLVYYLMRNRHGTPFEHTSFKFYVECPIFVAREVFRHRMASYNEESARYKKLRGVFWVPAENRGLVQEGKAGHYIVKPGTPEQREYAVKSLARTAEFCYGEYEGMLEQGICREVARAALTVAVYTSFYVTMNARGLMNFLSLRIDDPDNKFTTKPQYETDSLARQMEDYFRRVMPLTWQAFSDYGRVAP